MQSKMVSIFFIIGFAIQADAASLRLPGWKAKKGVQSAAPVVMAASEGSKNTAPAPAPVIEEEHEKGVGDLQAFAHLLPFHPRGQQEMLMKTRCVNFLNHILEKSAYSADAVGDLMPKCKWNKKECKALKDDLLKRLAKGKGGAPGPAPSPSFVQQPVPERAAPKDRAVTWLNGPRGPQPNFATAGGMDESIYGWCDKMYDMMRKKAIDELDEEQKELERKQARKKRRAEAKEEEEDEEEDDDDDKEKKD